MNAADIKQIICRYLKKKVAKNKCESISSGGAKTLYLFHDVVIGFYKGNEMYRRAKNNYQQYYDSLSFPTVKVLSFDDSCKSITMERVYGQEYADREHDKLVIKKLFEYAVKSPIREEKNGEFTYLQHGDTKRSNIIWIDEQNFVFIDLDGASFLPLLFDVLHYCANVGMSLTEIISIINENINSVQIIFEKFDLKFDSNYLDYIFYFYLLFFFRLGRFYNDISFLNYENTKSYPRTNSLMGVFNI